MTKKCCSSSECCPSNKSTNFQREVKLEFLYLDLSQCDWCKGTESSFDNAISRLLEIFRLTNVNFKVEKIHVTSEEEADKLGFTTYPTIRINGRDIQLDYKEALCTSCSNLCGEDVDCRLWIYQGKEYEVPPEGMIIEAILGEVYGKEVSSTSSPKSKKVPKNLKKFFNGLQEKKSDSVQLSSQK